MPRLSHPKGLVSVHVLAPRGISYVVYALLAALHAYTFRWTYTTIGEPHAVAVAQNERITATKALVEGYERRNLIKLQDGVTLAAEIPTFNETLVSDARALLRQLRQRMDSLTAAVQAGEVGPLSAALTQAIELHSDGRPFVDRYHLRTAAKKLQEA